MTALKEALRPILSCALVVAVSAAVHGQLTDTRFEKYTRFLTALILLSLLITPVLNLLGQWQGQGIDELLPDEDETGAEVTGTAGPGYADALMTVLAGRIEDDARAVLADDFGLTEDCVARLDVGLDGSNPEAIRVKSLEIVLRVPADPEDVGAIAGVFGERYGCERVSVIGDA